MKLYYFIVAPNPTKVRTYLAEKGIEVESVLVSLLDGEQKKPEFLAKNPRGKLPVLELDDGSFVCESLPIIEYFEELHPDPPMWGTTPEERVHARELERICDIGVLMGLGRYVHATNSPLGLPPNPAVAEDAWASALDTLALLDARIGDGPFVAGDRVTVADCTLHGALGFARFREVEVPERFGNVIRWWERFQKRPSTQL
ncbi:MAG: glutathione S-transferase family protein [Myxococcota bacterium]